MRLNPQAMPLMFRVSEVAWRFVVIVWALTLLYLTAIPAFSLLQLSQFSWGFQCSAIENGDLWCSLALHGPVVLGAPDEMIDGAGAPGTVAK